MPVYEYVCKACGHHLEVSQSFKDQALTECPVCSGPLRKVFGSIGIVLKGSGFYRTDSRLPAKKDKDKDKDTAKADAGGDRDKGTGDGAKPAADAKPATAAATSASTSTSDAKPSSGSGAAKSA